MTENQNTSDENQGESNQSGEGQESQDSNSKAEYETLKKQHDAANFKARKLEKELKTVNEKLQTLERKGVEDSGDINKIREAFSKDVQKEKERADSLEQRLRNMVLKNSFLSEAPKLFVDKSIDKVWKLIESDLDLQQDEAGEKVIVKDSALSFSDYLKKFAEENDYLAKNPALKGGGSKGAESNSSRTATLPSNWESLSKEQRTQWFKEHPDFKLSI